eukprot:c2264_g1_i1 orf=282-500(+)
MTSHLKPPSMTITQCEMIATVEANIEGTLFLSYHPKRKWFGPNNLCRVKASFRRPPASCCQSELQQVSFTMI